MFIKILFAAISLFLTLLAPFSISYASSSTAEKANKAGSAETKLAMSNQELKELLLFFDEDELFITATKHPQPLQEVPAIATIITADEIRKIGARNLGDVLKRVPGFGITQGFYGQKEIEMRGIKTIYSEKIKFLMDGHSLNNTVNGGHDSWGVTELPVENIKRIEIIRGPGSALYGSNAVLGVINVVTKDGKDIDGAIVTGGIGGYDSGKINLQAGKKFDKVEVAVTLDYLESIGPRMRIDRDAYGNSGYTDEHQKKYDLHLKAKYDDFTFSGKYIGRKNGPYIGVIQAVNENSEVDGVRYFGDLAYRHSLGENLDVMIRGYLDEFDWEAHWELLPQKLYPFPPGGMIGIPSLRERNIGTELQLDYRPVDSHALTVGAMYEDRNIYDVGVKANYCSDTTNTICTFGAPLGSLQDISNRWNWLEESRTNLKAIYLQDVWSPTENIGITAGVRYDEYSDFGSTTNPRAAVVWKFLKEWDMKLMYGEAFRAPMSIELYTMNNPAVLGNHDLKPEKIKTYEASIGHQLPGQASYRLTYFNSTLTDIIQEAGLPFRYQNTGRAKIDGVEAEIKWHFSGDTGTYVNANYAYQRPVDEETGKDLKDVPKNRGNIGLNLEVNRYLNANTNVLMVGERPRADGDTRSPMPAYAVVDIALNVKNLYKGLELWGTVTNLFDQRYSDPSRITATTPAQVDDMPREGTNYFIKAEYKF